MKMWKSMALAVLALAAFGKVKADELVLVQVHQHRGGYTPLYVRQSSGSPDAQLRGVAVGSPVELYEERRVIVLRDTGPYDPYAPYGAEPREYRRVSGPFVVQR